LGNLLLSARAGLFLLLVNLGEKTAAPELPFVMRSQIQSILFLRMPAPEAQDE